MIYDHWKPHNVAYEQLDEVYSDGDRGRDDARSETLTNATMTASLTPAVMPARHLGPVAIFQWRLVWAMICLLLAYTR
jgi:hypothetical protein